MKDLQELLNKSSSSRRYFMSLPVKVQMSIHQNNEYIKTAEQLHKYVNYVTNNIIN